MPTPDLNQLFYGDNLEVLKKMDSAFVDLIYLDPPFNSDAVYNVSFANAGDAAAQIQAFDDTWRWTPETSSTYDQLVSGGGLPPLAAECLEAIRALTKESPLTAYMVAMAPRLVELHRVLKATGSLYLHCDPTASHYLKIMLDAIFGPTMFRNEIIWRRTGAHSPRNSFGPVHDVILFYTKTPAAYFKPLKRPYSRQHVESRYTQDSKGWKFTSGGNVLTGPGATSGESGQEWRGFNPSAKNRHWAVPGFVTEQMPESFATLGVLDKLEAAFQAGLIEITAGKAWPEPVRYLKPTDGTSAGDIWAYQPGTAGVLYGTDAAIDEDVMYLGPTSPERLGYPTQKPVGLLERIINASCPPDGVVLDPFCGCGTTIAAAQKLGRRWIGIDITFIAIDLIRNRLADVFDNVEGTYEVLGIPHDLAAAHALFEKSHFEFERWAVSLVHGTPKDKPGGDSGHDGLVRFYKGKRSKPGHVVVSVKGGKQLNPSMIRDLEGTVHRDRIAEAGILITLWDPTSGMRKYADQAPTFPDPVGNPYPTLQILTITELLAGKIAKLPPVMRPYTQADSIVEDTAVPLFEM